MVGLSFVRLLCIVGVFTGALFSSVGEASDLEVGVASDILKIPRGISLAGYFERRHWVADDNPLATYFRAHDDIHDNLRVKAVVIKFGDRRIAMVSVDIIAVFPGFRDLLERRLASLGYHRNDILLFATHTHSGPGGFVNVPFWEIFAVDKYIQWYRDLIAIQMEAVIRKADSSVQSARISVEERYLGALIKNRRSGPVSDDQMLIWSFLASDEQPIASLLIAPAHGTLLPPENSSITADVGGEIERRWEKRVGGVALFVSGPAGDIEPVGDRSFAGLSEFGDRFEREIIGSNMRGVLGRTAFVPTRLETFFVDAPLERPRLNIRACLDLAGPLKKLVPRSLPLPKMFDVPIRVEGLLVDGHALVLVPGEPFNNIGRDIRESGVSTFGFSTAAVAGLANSYMGYIMDAHDYDFGGYEVCNSFYGPSYGERIRVAASQLYKNMSEVRW